MFPERIISMGTEHQECFAAVWDHVLYCAHCGKAARAVSPATGRATQIPSEVQERSDLQTTRRWNICLKHMQTSLRLIILRSFELNMLGSSFAEETLIRKFLISCAGELKAWVLIPWAKEPEYLGEYCYNWGFLFKSFGSEVWKWRLLFKCSACS